MKPTKINISPEVREFNEQVEHADWMTDYKLDTKPAEELLEAMRPDYPSSAYALSQAICRLAIKR